MDATLADKALPPGAVFGRLEPEGLGPTCAEEFETLDQEDGNPLELIGGWVLQMSPGNFESGRAWTALCAVLLPWITARKWTMSADARHRLPSPPRTVVFPDIVIHCVPAVPYLPGTETIGRVPDLVVEFLSRKSYERDMSPSGAKFLAYQMSGVREYYHAWPDGRDASGFSLQKGIFVPLPRDADGFIRSPLLGCALRLVEAAVRGEGPSSSTPLDPVPSRG